MTNKRNKGRTFAIAGVLATIALVPTVVEPVVAYFDYIKVRIGQTREPGSTLNSGQSLEVDRYDD